MFCFNASKAQRLKVGTFAFVVFFDALILCGKKIGDTFKLKSLRLPSCESRTNHTVCAYAALKVGQTQTIPFVRVTDLFLGRLQGIW